MNKTQIEWTDYTTNPFKARHRYILEEVPNCPRCGMLTKAISATKAVNLCVKVSPGCAHCYASTLTQRWGGPGYLARAKECFEPVLDEKELQRILRAKVQPGQNKVFPFDMTDWAWEFWPDEFLDKFFAVVALRPDWTFQVLTKRAERMHAYFAVDRYELIERVERQLWEMHTDDTTNAISDWPLPNVQLGISAEDQPRFDERWPFLRDTPAAVRWVSYEPGVGPIDFTRSGHVLYPTDALNAANNGALHFPTIDWIVVGGESGPGARPFDVQWARDTIAQCRAAGIPVFMKQLGAMSLGRGQSTLLKDRKGGDWSEWPEDLRVREFPS